MAKNTFVILGYGRSGLQSERYLARLGYRVLVFDDGQNKTPTINWDEVVGMVQSPGIPPSHPVHMAARAAGAAVITDINLLQQRNPKAKYIGITGTNGKSTTTALIGHILKKYGLKVAVGGNIGVPALNLEELDEDGWYVLELSSYQLELSTDIALDIAVWVNISPDHLERHGSMEDYVKAKQKIFSHAKFACIAQDDNYSKSVAQTLVIPHKTIASEFKNAPADVWIDSGGALHGAGKTFNCLELEILKGLHNWQNVALAFAACTQVTQDPKAVFEHIQTFPGLIHRQQFVRKINEVTFINDSKATNADATEKALKAFIGEDIFWILGGVAKTDGIEPLAPYFSFIKKTYLIGEASERFAKTLYGQVEFEKCNSLDKAVKNAYHDAISQSGGVVLLSPACASLDQFRDFEHRGEEFIRLVMGVT